MDMIATHMTRMTTMIMIMVGLIMDLAIVVITKRTMVVHLGVGITMISDDTNDQTKVYFRKDIFISFFID